MGVFTRILPLLVVAITVACTSPSTSTTEDRPGNAAATITSSPASAGDDTGAEGSAGIGADGQDGQDGRSGRGDDVDGQDSGTPPTSSGGPDGGSFSVTNNDVMIGAKFGRVNDPFSFGSTSPGSTTKRTVKVGSNGEVTVSSVEVSSGTGVFRIVTDGCTGASFPRPSCHVTLAATPAAEGEHLGVLRIHITNSLDPTSLDLKVTAEAGDPGLSGSTGETPDEESTQPEEPPEESTQPEEPPTTSG